MSHNSADDARSTIYAMAKTVDALSRAWRGLIPDPLLRAPQRRLPIEQVVELRDALKAAHYEVISNAAMRKAYPQLT